MEQVTKCVLLLVLLHFIQITLSAKIGACSSKGSSEVLPLEVEIANCTDSEPCYINKGTNISLQVTFIPDLDVPVGGIFVYGRIGRLKAPFKTPLLNNICEQINETERLNDMECTLTAQHKYTLQLKLPMKKLLPEIPMILEWSLLSKSRNPIFCFVTKVHITHEEPES